MLLYEISAMPAEQRLKRAIASHQKHSDELQALVRTTLDEPTPDEAELRKLQRDLAYTEEALKRLYKELHDHYMDPEKDNVPQEDLDTCYKNERDQVLPLGELLRQVGERLKPRESSSRSWWPHMKLETFTGELGKFQSWIDSFEASVDLRTDLHEMEKLNILKKKGHLKGYPY